MELIRSGSLVRGAFGQYVSRAGWGIACADQPIPASVAALRDAPRLAIRANWDPHELLDFDSGFDATDFGPDGRHFKGVGHAKRAIRAAGFLQKDSSRKPTSEESATQIGRPINSSGGDNDQSALQP